MKPEKLSIKNKEGEELHASMELPDNGKPQQYAIFAHCFTCNSDFAAVRNISRELTNHGFGVIRFDFTGLGKSGGAFAETNFSANISDISEVNSYITEHFQAPSLLIGHSLGGAAALVAGNELDNIQAVVVVGAPAEAVHVKHIFESSIEKIKEEGEAKVNIGGRPFKIQKHFLEDLDRNDVLKNIKNLRKPLLILHSPQDKIVEIENAAKIYRAAHHPKSFVSLDGADHLLSNKKDSRYVANIIGAWVGRYLEDVHENAENLNTENSSVAAHLDFEDGFTTHITNGKHALIADEPQEKGGQNLGFMPPELVESGLGACTAMTLKMYAERKEWPLKQVYVYLDYRKSDEKHTIQRKIKLVGDVDDKQRKRLIEIAEKCPVHKMLTEEIVIETEED